MAKVVIFGATSAIAASCAALYAARGDALHLVGRSADKLAALGARLAMAKVVPQITQADLDDVDGAVALWSRVTSALGGADTVLIAHGLLGDQLAAERDFAEAERIIHTNFVSVVALLVPIANHFEAQGGGRLGVITSVAGERGRPRNYTYGATKGALNLYLQGVRSRLYPFGVSVTALKLGPVHTPMTETHRKNRLFVGPDEIAGPIVAAVDRRRAEVFAPAVWSAIMPIVRHVPEPLFQRLRFLSGR
jgi:short-subunit dehydrogenase